LEQQLEASNRQLEAANNLVGENTSARKSAEKQLEKVQKEFDEYWNKKRKEHKKVLDGAQKAADVYKDLLSSVREETEAPRDAPVEYFTAWLASELATISHYMTVGREYASFESICAFAQALEEVGCDHLEKFKIKDLQTYWNAPARA
jgi:chromosome segregation ATPase